MWLGAPGIASYRAQAPLSGSRTARADENVETLHEFACHPCATWETFFSVSIVSIVSIPWFRPWLGPSANQHAGLSQFRESNFGHPIRLPDCLNSPPCFLLRFAAVTLPSDKTREYLVSVIFIYSASFVSRMFYRLKLHISPVFGARSSVSFFLFLRLLLNCLLARGGLAADRGTGTPCCL